MQQTLYKLGITPSKSRPRVSNDNPYAESICKTFKYRPGFPYKGFVDINKAKKWTSDFANWYNFEYRHSEINFLTPHQRHNGLSEEMLERRKEVYEQVKLKHPERWSRNTRNWTIEDVVWLNPEKDTKISKIEDEQSS